MLLRIHSFLFVLSVGLAGLFSSADAFEAPWKDAKETLSPWGSSEQQSSDRKENREGFFEGLNTHSSTAALEESLVQRTERSPALSDEQPEQIDSGRDMKGLPWQAHRTLYPAQKFSAKLLWPVETGHLTSGYGIRGGKFHEGLDISAVSGSWIRAVGPGRVVFNGNLSGYGRVIVIYHGDGISSVYAHNSENLKRRGSVVKKGDVIAKVGRTGHASGDHCHFEIRKDGKPVNPLRFTYARNPVLARR